MRFFLACVIAIILFAAVLVLRAPAPVIKEPLPPPAPFLSPTPPPPPDSMDINEGGKTYRVVWLKIPNPSTLSLIPNFAQKRTAQSLIESKECAAVANGGFYTKDNQPTGLFINEGKTLRGSIPNTFLNGFFVVTQNNNASILISPPVQTARLSLQTGPILIRDEKIVKLVIRDDEFARRVVVGITKKGEIIFLVLYDLENSWSGPRLADTPGVLSGVIERLQITDALNLDGGSASAFIRDDLSLQELTSVGSFFCIKRDY